MDARLPSVAIVVPNYNYEKTLALCLEAIFNQDHLPDEVIVVDDHSTDSSRDIASRFPCKLISTPRNSGVAAARNEGVVASSSEVIFFVDSDVRLEKDAVGNALRRLATDDSLGSVCGIYHPEPLIDDGVVERYRSLQAHFWRASSVGLVTPGFFSLGAVRRTVFDSLGLFDTTLLQTEEVEFGCRMADGGYGLFLAPDVVGAHDDDDELVIIWRKLFRRGRLRVPLYLARRRFMRGFETPARGLAAVGAFGAVLSSPVILKRGPWTIVPASLTVLSILCDLPLYKFVLQRKGPGFLVFFAGAHFTTNVAISTGLLAGCIQWCTSQSFRSLYANSRSASYQNRAVVHPIEATLNDD